MRHSEYGKLLALPSGYIGKQLLEEAVRFCRKCKYKTIFHWTTNELVAAGRLYIRFRFIKTEEKEHKIWRKELTEEKYELRMQDSLPKRQTLLLVCSHACL